MVAYRSDRTPTGVLMQFPRNPPTEVERTGHVDEIANIVRTIDAAHPPRHVA